jgi:large subunit ribosomal protein L6
MSRVGKKPVEVPEGVTVAIRGAVLKVKGPLGELERSLHPNISVSVDDEVITVQRPSDSRTNRSLHGLTRALIANMVRGVSRGYERQLEIQGVGYRAAQQGSGVMLELGYSHPVAFIPPDGVEVAVETPTRLTIKGIDKELVGRVAAKIRSFRKPEPYKGKGIRFVGEHVRRKAGKTTG